MLTQDGAKPENVAARGLGTIRVQDLFDISANYRTESLSALENNWPTEDSVFRLNF